MKYPKDNTPFYILSVDGGGMRGVFPAQVLALIEEQLGCALADRVHMVAGTSTGSILAAAVSQRIPMNKAIELYQQRGPKIFKRNALGAVLGMIKAAYSSLYSNDILLSMLTSALGEVTLGEVELPLLLPASDMGSCRLHSFRSVFAPELSDNSSVLLYKAVQASCSAPMFFEQSPVNGRIYADGCLWANNPTLAAMLDAKKYLKVSFDNMRVLSLGVGRPKEICRKNERNEWVGFPGWQSSRAVEIMMAFQSESVHYSVEQLIPAEHYLRIEFETNHPLPIDDCALIPFLQQQGQEWFKSHQAEVESFWLKD